MGELTRATRGETHEEKNPSCFVLMPRKSSSFLGAIFLTTENKRLFKGGLQGR